MYPYLLEFTRISDLAALFYLSRLVTPGYRTFDFGREYRRPFCSYQRRVQNRKEFLAPWQRWAIA
jgi:hypothetical protein